MVRRIAVTGGAGNIAYSLLFRLAREPIALHILEIPEAVDALKGVAMELQDCAFPNLHEIRVGSDPYEIFGDVDLAILVGAQPRTKGMERKDLLQKNAQIFVEQGKALHASASSNAKVLVVGNPCNTNAWITRHYAPDLDIHAMTRLDQNRATAQLALKTGKKVTDMTIWGNHSSTQVPDFSHALVDGQPAPASPELEPIVQKRGAAIIEARGKSSAASAANAILDAIYDLDNPTSHFSSAVYSAGNPYNIDPDLIFSFPLQSKGSWKWEIIPGLSWDASLEAKIRATEAELIEEREQVKSYV